MLPRVIATRLNGASTTTGDAMNTRKKTKIEAQFDHDEVDETQAALNVAYKDFVSEFMEMEGDVLYSTFTKVNNAMHLHDRSVDYAAMKKVGDTFDFEKGVVGKWRYPFLREVE